MSARTRVRNRQNGWLTEHLLIVRKSLGSPCPMKTHPRSTTDGTDGFGYLEQCISHVYVRNLSFL